MGRRQKKTGSGPLWPVAHIEVPPGTEIHISVTKILSEHTNFVRFSVADSLQEPLHKVAGDLEGLGRKIRNEAKFEPNPATANTVSQPSAASKALKDVIEHTQKHAKMVLQLTGNLPRFGPWAVDEAGTNALIRPETLRKGLEALYSNCASAPVFCAPTRNPLPDFKGICKDLISQTLASTRDLILLVRNNPSQGHKEDMAKEHDRLLAVRYELLSAIHGLKDITQQSPPYESFDPCQLSVLLGNIDDLLDIIGRTRQITSWFQRVHGFPLGLSVPSILASELAYDMEPECLEAKATKIVCELAKSRYGLTDLRMAVSLSLKNPEVCDTRLSGTSSA